jgi:hypothetical protein
MRWTVLLVCASIALAQQDGQRRSTGTDPCPGGVGTAQLETEPVLSLDQLVRASQLIVVGTVAKVLPAFNPDPEHRNSVETNSLVTVTQTLYGKVPGRTSTITLAQIGGQVGRCGEVVEEDPLVKADEQYVLFLWNDNRKNVPNASGSPRYGAVGVWAGKAKIVNGKVRFLPDARPPLHEYDDTAVGAFIETVAARIAVLR